MMDAVTIVVLLVVVLFFPFSTAGIASSLGRKFWVWFFLGLLLPFFSLAMLLCLPVKKAVTHGNRLLLKYQNAKNGHYAIELNSSAERKYSNRILSTKIQRRGSAGTSTDN